MIPLSIVVHGSMEGGGGGYPPQSPISYLVTYELFEALMYCDPPPSPQPHGQVCY